VSEKGKKKKKKKKKRLKKKKKKKKKTDNQPYHTSQHNEKLLCTQTEKEKKCSITWCLPHCSQEEHGTYVTVLPVSTMRANICAGVPIQSRVV